MKKSVGKSKRPAPPHAFKPGPDSRRGRGPAKGAPNAGRPRDEWKLKLQAIASQDAVIEHINEVLLRGSTDPFYGKALDYVTEHGYGRAAQPIEHSGAVTLLSDAERKQRVADLMQRAAD